MVHVSTLILTKQGGVSTVVLPLRASHGWLPETEKSSYDSSGSHESIQILQSQGYEAEHLSVDTTTQPYATLKELSTTDDCSVITFQNWKRNCSDCNMTRNHLAGGFGGSQAHCLQFNPVT